MSDELGWPIYINVDPESWEILSPPQLIREFAGIYGESFGFTTQLGIVNGVRDFENTSLQDVFRHAFVHGVRSLQNWDHERYLNSLPLSPITKTNEALFDSVSDGALWWGFSNEFAANNPIEQHLMDLWNNAVGVELAREFMLLHGGDRSEISNDSFAAFMAEKVLQNPEMFIFSESDSRVLNPSLYDPDFLPADPDIIQRLIVRLLNDGQMNSELLQKLHELFPNRFPGECFLAGTPILLPDGSTKSIEDVTPGDTVLSYDAAGVLVPGRVVRVFRKEVEHLLDVHGLKVTPGHVTLCGDGVFAGRHVPIIDILLSDGALVTAGGALVRMATNAPVGSPADAKVKVAVALTAADLAAGRLAEAEMRAGTLLFDRDGAAVSVLDCLGAEGCAFDPATGLIAKPGEDPHPLHWFGPVPRPEDYILRRSRETLEGILTGGEWERSAPALVAARLRQISGMRVN